MYVVNNFYKCRDCSFLFPLGSVVSSLVLLIVIVGVIVVIILAYNRYRSITHQDETDMAIPLEVLNNGNR